MTTLRDYVLDCRCPNCGTLMQQRKPKRRFWLLAPVLSLIGLIVATIYGAAGHYAHAAYVMSLAVFIALGPER